MKYLNILIPLSIIVSCIVAQEANNYRLPTTVEPSNYHIQLTPYFQNEGGKAQFTFDGIVDITIVTTQLNIREIVLHSLDLTISSYSLVEYQDNLRSIQIESITDVPLTQKKVLALAGPLTVNQLYLLKFEYRGILGADMNGFYRSSYTENGNIK